MARQTIPHEILEQVIVPYQDCLQRVLRLHGENAALYLADIMTKKRSDRALNDVERSGIHGQIHGFYCFADPLLRAI